MSVSKANHEELLIRQATESDLPRMEWEGRYQHFRRLYRHAMAEASRGRRILLVAEAHGKLVGQIFVQLDSAKGQLADGKKTGYLYAFRVRPRFRNRGIGSRLLAEAERALRSRAVRRAVIAVARDNAAARRLYERRGYHRFADDPGRWSFVDHQGKLQWVHEPAHLLEKDL